MRVLSFGRTALSTTERIKRVVEIIRQIGRINPEIAIVVSAMTGVTDVLVEIAQDAAKGLESYKQGLTQLKTDHMETAAGVVVDKSLNYVYDAIHRSFHHLQEVLHGVFLVREITPKTLDLIKGYGEIWAAEIVAGGLQGAIENITAVDARPLIRTNNQFGSAMVDFEESIKLIRDFLSDKEIIPVFTGFVGSTASGEATTLGRGGSDLTAVVVGAALKAHEVDIWSERNGVMTSDPTKVPHAYPISMMTYKEALELSHFGAKVLFPPALIPAQKYNIPIRIRNPLLENSAGTMIVAEVAETHQPIRGISSIDSATVIRLDGGGLVGVAGVAKRIFGTLAAQNISVMMISLCSSEYSMCLAIPPDKGDIAKAALEKEFEEEIRTLLIDRVIVDEKMAIIGVVGENMHHSPGVSGRLFSSLGRNGINVVAMTQGSSELNISFVIDKENEVKALQVLHEEFFVTRSSTLNVFLAGVGKIGSTLLAQLARQARALLENEKINLKIVGLANSKKMIFDSKGIDPVHWRDALNRSTEEMEIHDWFSKIKKMNLMDSVLIDCSSSEKLTHYYQMFLDSNISVIASNLRANIGPYHSYLDLRELARRRGVEYLYEASVGDGVPVLSIIKKMVNSGDRITSVEAVLSPFTSKVLAEYPKHQSFSKAVKTVYENDFPYLDPRTELCGKWTASELLVLARECGRPVELEDILVTSLVPDRYLKSGSIDQFLKGIVDFDEEFDTLYQSTCGKGKRLVYRASFNPEELKVEPDAIGEFHPLYRIPGGQNAVVVCSERYRKFPLVISAQSADPETIAGVVFADLVRTAIR